MKVFSHLKVTSLILISALTFASNADEIIKAECKEIVKESCGSKDLENCMKSSKKDKDLETCFGVLLTEADVPEQVKVLQSRTLFDSNKASCFTAVASGCGSMEVSECMQKKGNLFPSMCRDLFYEIKEQQTRMDAISGHCFKKYFDTCQQKYDVPLTSYNLFVSGLKSIESCTSVNLLKDNMCVAAVKEAAQKRAAEAAKKAEEAKKLKEKEEKAS